MSRHVRRISLTLLFGLTLILAGCPTPEAPKTIKIEKMGWVLENIDTSYWSSPFDDATCFGWFAIPYTGDGIVLSDIDYVHMHHGDLTWNISVDSDHVDLENKCIYVLHAWTGSLSPNGSVFPIGEITFEVGLVNDESATYVLDVPIPGQTTSGTKNYIYTEDFGGVPAANYTPMLKRPVFVSDLLGGATIDISFSSNDPIFFSGHVDFYDDSNNWVGNSPAFRSYGSGVIAAFVNGGAALNNDGTPNALSLVSGSISYATGKSFSNIAKYAVSLTDGAQYLGTSSTFDCIAIGARTTF
jgi:hypothetical protein